jgi:hypothetical protein
MPDDVPLNEPKTWNGKPIRPVDTESIAQPANIDPSLVNANSQQSFFPSTKAQDVGPSQPNRLGQSEYHQSTKDFQEHGLSDDCLEDAPRQTPLEKAHIDKPKINDDIKSSPKSTDFGQASEICKTPRPNMTPQADAKLREAITAVFKPKAERNGGSPHGVRDPHGSRQAGQSELTPVTDTQEEILPAWLITPTGTSDTNATSPPEEIDSRLIKEVLQRIKEAGFVVKQSKPAGKAVNSDRQSKDCTAKKGDKKKVQCTRCTKFSGRPCELK